MSTFYSFALSNAEGTIQFYRSNLPTPEGVDSGEGISDGPMWENVEEQSVLALAWANVIATGEPQTVRVTAKRNGRPVEITVWKMPEITPMIITHGIWIDDRKNALTQNEIAVCKMLTAGRTADQVAADLDISRSTVQRYRNEAMIKLGVNTHEQLGARFC